MQKFIWMEYMCIMVGFIYILVHSHFELFSLHLALEGTKMYIKW